MEDEICKCGGVLQPIVLQYDFSEYSIKCLDCNLYRLGLMLPDALKLEIGLWNDKYDKEYKIWLNDDILTEQLSNPMSELNQIGLRIVEKLNKIIPTYYWWHLAEDETLDFCPKCNEQFLKFGRASLCNKCKIMIRNSANQSSE